MLEYSQYPEAADDSVVPDDNTIKVNNFNIIEVPPPSAVVEDEEGGEGYDDEEEEIRQLNRRSGRGLYVLMAILAVVAIAALAVGSTLLVQKKLRSGDESIESAEQIANSPPPPSPSPPGGGGVSVTTSSPTLFRGTNTVPNTGNETLENSTTTTGTGINATENGINEVGFTSGTSGGGGSVDILDGATGGSTVDILDGATEGNDLGGSNGGAGGSGGNSTTDGGDFLDVVDGSPTSSPGGEDDTTDESSGGSNQDSSGSTIVDGGGNSSKCVSGGRCSEEGSTCAIGKETCCGQTFNSLECECSSGQWLCQTTDACNRPDCGDLNTTAPSATNLPSPPPSSSSTIVAPQAAITPVPTKTTDAPSVNIARFPSASPVPSSEPTCGNSIEVEFVTEGQGNLDNTGYTLLSTPGCGSETYMETLPGDLKNTTSSQYSDVACVPSGIYIFTVYDDTSKCCGDNKGYYAVKINGEEVVRCSSSFTSPNAYIIRADYEPPTAQPEIQWLNKHNDVREQFHTQNGKSFRPLVWSDSLAKAAAERANDIATTCGSGSVTMDPWGENIGHTNFGVYNEAFVNPDYVFGGWNNFEDHPLTYWQINWRPTRYVGCATNITQMQTDGRYCHVAICKYTRPHCNVNNETWLNQTLEDFSPCGPPCPMEGCY